MLRYIPAKFLYRQKFIYPDGAIREMVLWQLPRPSKDRSHGLKYRLYYGLADGTCVVRYDNETGKGDHRHIESAEEPYTFSTPDQLMADFEADVARWNHEHGRS